jgi:nitroimidazol reductase NimA-like FMN-containing flavoprotein (pyridoxamine 5'-phosphate oxidase superfamily)
MAKPNPAPSDRTRVKRLPDRGHYDRATIDAILDAMPLAHVAYVLNGAPIVTPTLQWREGDHVYFHGSAASRMLESSEDAAVCLSVTLMDGLVLARSAFHHSINYRAVMLMGRATKVADPEEKETRLKNFVDGLFAGRWDMLRPVNKQEVKATTVLSLPISEASAKIRVGPPKDDEEDYALDIWAGVLPLRLVPGEPVPDPRNKPGLQPPAHVGGFKIG